MDTAKPARHPQRPGRELEPEPGDSETVAAWKQCMASETGQQIYRQRAATSKTVNADLRSYRGLNAAHGTRISQDQMRAVVVFPGLQRNALRAGNAA